MSSTLPEGGDCEDIPKVALLTTPSQDGATKQEAVNGTSVRQVVCVVVVALTCMSLGTALQGWTAVLPKMQDDPRGFTVTNDDVAWLVSVTSIVGILASLCTGPLVEWTGPRWIITTAEVISVALWLLLAFLPNKAVFFCARAGLAAAAYVISTASIPLLAELCPSKIRGTMTALTEVSMGLGVLVGYMLAYLFDWQVATALCTLSAGLLVLPLLLVPESPYWLVRRSRKEEARAALLKLKSSKIAANEELLAIISMPTATQTSRIQQFTALAKGRNARPVLLVLSIFVLRELGGRSTIMVYTVYIFREAGVQLDAFMCTVLVGVVRTLFPCLTAVLLEKTGRRPLLMATVVVGGVALGICGLFLHLQLQGASWVPLAAVLIYVSAYGAGIGPIPWVYVGELLPSPVRSLGASLSTASESAALFTISIYFLPIISYIGLGVTFMVFSGFNLIIGVIVWLWIPESRGATLQQLETVFSTKVVKR